MAIGTLSGTASKIWIFIHAGNTAYQALPFQLSYWAYASTSAGAVVTETMADGTVQRVMTGVITFDPTSATASSVRTQIQTAVRSYYGNNLATVVNLMDTAGLLGL